MSARPAIAELPPKPSPEPYRLTPTEKSHVVRFILGVLLLASAGFKVHSLWTGPGAGFRLVHFSPLASRPD